jgi:AcrR family transcriptional regulator
LDPGIGAQAMLQVSNIVCHNHIATARMGSLPLAPKTTARSGKIIRSAGQLFARQGYHGTSTREIALVASVSENTIFRHFESKEGLFWASLRAYSADLRVNRDLLQGIAKGEAPEVVLPKIIQVLTDMADYKPELLRLIAVAFLEMNGKAEDFCQDHLSPVLAVIYQYLAMSMKKGEMRDMDPSMTTAALISMVLMHPGIARMIRGGKAGSMDSRKAARAYSKYWLNLLTSG